MKFVTVSDVHIKEPGDEAEILFIKFLNSDEVKNSNAIFLLGDIFDLMVGGYREYRVKFKRVFDCLIELCDSGKMIYQFEGNHDFHFQQLITYINEKELKRGRWTYLSCPYMVEVDNQRILFAHGDELEVDNPSYQLYRYLIRSSFIKNLADYFATFNFVESIGKYFSNKSRKRNFKNYGQNFNQDIIREKFRRSAEIAKKRYDCDIYICGHSHCLEQWKKPSFMYFNNGYFPKERSFFFWDELEIRKITVRPADQ